MFEMSRQADMPVHFYSKELLFFPEEKMPWQPTNNTWPRLFKAAFYMQVYSVNVYEAYSNITSMTDDISYNIKPQKFCHVLGHEYCLGNYKGHSIFEKEFLCIWFRSQKSPNQFNWLLVIACWCYTNKYFILDSEIPNIWCIVKYMYHTMLLF